MEIKKYNISFQSKEIYGLLIDNNLLEKEIEKNNKVCYINNQDFLVKTVSDEFFLVKHNVQDKDDYIEKIVSCLEMVGLNESYLERIIYSLSMSEKILLKLATSLITNPDTIIIEHQFSNLDRKNKLNIFNLLKELKHKYDKTIIIIEEDINILLEICNRLIIFKNNELIINDYVENIFNNIELLLDNNIELPDLIKFSLIAKNYGKKIGYYNNVNDLIKEVYKKC